ncbi:CPBP family intramembrane metalloprotease [Phycisphaeraceae bacterium D3-23]
MTSETLNNMTPATWVLLALTAGMLGLLWAGGAMTPKALQRGPKRDVGMGVGDVLAAFGLYALGMVLAGLVGGVWMQAVGAQTFEEMSLLDIARFSLVSSIVMFGPGIAYLVWRLQRGGNLRLGGVVPRHPIRDIGVAAIALPVAFLGAIALGLITLIVFELFGYTTPDHGHVVLEMLANNDSPTVLLFMSISAVVLAPLTEEFFFRGFVQTAVQSTLGHQRRWTSIFITASFFGVIHLGSVPPPMVAPLILLGVIFGWVYERTGSIWCAVLVHAGYNGINVLLNQAQHAGGETENAQVIGCHIAQLCAGLPVA